ncbi:hypothetical protein GCM10022393_36370 [Aquimarina addita]|uniref:Outer membrane protein beta-barrel domain-containing protein n=1 Tax=Aquimarina addita TaxID=870485 RepID=A0ABP6URU9_9FLAO
MIYKSYLDGTTKRTNTNYKTQLWTDLQCSNISLKEVRSTEYKRKSLTKYFLKYNNCNGDISNVVNSQEKGRFKLTAIGGISANSLKVSNRIDNIPTIDFDSKFTFRIGLESEYIFAFNRNKWAAFLTPTYQSFNSNKDIIFLRQSSGALTTNMDVNYQSIEVPLGIRHYMFLNTNSKLFIDGALVLDIPLNSEIVYEDYIDDFKVSSGISFSAGIGYDYKNRYKVQLRYAPRDLGDGGASSYKYSSISLVLGYSIFNNIK